MTTNARCANAPFHASTERNDRAMVRYVCDIDDEDLTAEVEAARKGSGVPVAEMRAWSVTVYCSKGHENTFSEGDDIGRISLVEGRNNGD